jgi:hypothetical protein
LSLEPFSPSGFCHIRVNFSRRTALVLVGAGVVALSAAPVVCPALRNDRRRSLTVAERRGIPDCPSEASRNLSAPDALECWFYTERAAWRIVSRVSAHHALVVRTEVTQRDAALDVARTIVATSQSDFGEVLVYASSLRERRALTGDTASVTITRIRWTPAEGFSTLTYQMPIHRSPGDNDPAAQRD